MINQGKIEVDKNQAAQAIQMAMVWHGFSQRALARETGINQALISMFLRGRLELNRGEVQKILRTVGLDWNIT